MDIRFYTASSPYIEHRSPAPAADRSRSVTEKASGDYDKATFKQTSAPADDSSFASMLTQAVSARVSSGTSSRRIAEIRQQVASGTYTPDARRIAERMLGYR